MILVNSKIFLSLFFWEKHLEMMFSYVLGYKNINFTKPPNWMFPWFLSIISKIFHFLFLSENKLEKMFGDVLDRKQVFVDYKCIHFT